MNKNLLIVPMIVLVLAASAFANGVENPDKECGDHGFDFGIAKYECDGGNWALSDDGERAGYTTSATGDSCTSVDWTSNPAADNVLEKAEQDYFTHPGGTSGTDTKSGQHDISHITLCGYDEGGEIPEFSVLAAVAVLGIAGIII